jgi:hypothetical protein
MSCFKRVREVPAPFQEAVSLRASEGLKCSTTYYQKFIFSDAEVPEDPDTLYEVGTRGQGGPTFLCVLTRCPDGKVYPDYWSGPPSLAEGDVVDFLLRLAPPSAKVTGLQASSRSVPTHHLKCWPDRFQMIVDGTKPYEVREDDRGYRMGDLLVLSEWEPKLAEARDADGYTGRSACGVVLSVLPPPDVHVLKGYVVMGVCWYYFERARPGEPPTVKRLGGAG